MDISSKFIKELYENTEAYPTFVERFNNLNNDIKTVLERASLKDEILECLARINIAKDYYDTIARNIAFLLLQIMEPRDLFSELSKDMPEVNKDIINALVKQIEDVIVTKPILELINQNWAEDDAEAEELANEIEIAMVPLPPNKIVDFKYPEETVNLNRSGSSFRPSKIFTNEDLTNIKEVPKPLPSNIDWEEKVSRKDDVIPAVQNRSNVDTTTKPITRPSVDVYRESMEE